MSFGNVILVRGDLNNRLGQREEKVKNSLEHGFLTHV